MTDADFAKLISKVVLYTTALAAIGICVVTGANGCQVDDIRAVEVLRSNDVTEPALSGAVWLACEPGELSRRFVATRAGHYVEGVVCCGILAKACTVRW